VPSRKPSSTQSPPPRTKSAITRRRKPEVIEESPRPQSAYLTEYIPPPIKVDMAIQSDETEQPPQEPQPDSPMPPPGTPDINREVPEPQPSVPELQPSVPELQPSEPAVTEELTTQPLEEKENIEPSIGDEMPLVREEPLGDETPQTEERRIR